MDEQIPHPGLISDPDKYTELALEQLFEVNAEQSTRIWDNISRQVEGRFDPDQTQPCQAYTDEESTALYFTAENVEREWKADFEQEDAFDWLSAVESTSQPETPFVMDPLEGFGDFELDDGQVEYFRILTSKEKTEYRNILRLIDEAKAERPELWL